MSTFTHKINNTRFIIKTGKVQDEDSDVLFNWTTSNLISGDDIFMQIHKEGGSVINKECQGALAKFGVKDTDETKIIRLGEAVLTSAGILPVRKIVHVVTPNHRIKQEKENKLNLLLTGLNYAFALINESSKSTVPFRKITIPTISERIYGNIVKEDIQALIKGLVSNVNSYNFREVRILCSSEEQFEIYKKIFSSNYISFSERLYTKLFC